MSDFKGVGEMDSRAIVRVGGVLASAVIFGGLAVATGEAAPLALGLVPMAVLEYALRGR